MTKTSFFARTSLGLPRYLLVAMACAFVLALIPLGARRALQSSANKVEGWLPAAYAEVRDFAWFNDHFRGEQFALVSWDGCTLGEPEQLELLAKKLMPADAAAASGDATSAERTQWYARVVTGPRALRELMQSQPGLSYADAIARFEGALVGPPQRDAQGRTLGNESRTTCMIVYLTSAAASDVATKRAAIEGIGRIASIECGIPAATIHMGGPPVDDVTIDAEGQRTLVRLAALAGAVGAGLCYWRLRSVRLTMMVFGVGAVCAAMSLALVFYMGVLEVSLLRRPAPVWGTLDAVLLAMPAIVFLFATTAALYAINDYFAVRERHGLLGAAETTVALGWRPMTLAAVAAAAGVGALATSEIVPLQKFGLFAAAGVLAMAGVLLAILPVLLHRYPLSEAYLRARKARRENSRGLAIVRALADFAAQHHAAALAATAILAIALGAGVLRLGASVQVLSLLDADADLVEDYAWLEQNLGNLVPMEVVLTMPPERLRAGDEHAEQDGQQYRVTMLERMELLRQIERRLEAFSQISRAMSAAAFAPASTTTGLESANRGGDYAKNKALEFYRERLLAGDYLRLEREPDSDRATGRELWRLCARVSATSSDGSPVDYAVFLEQLKRSVEPVLVSYQQRDLVVRALHEQGKQLNGAHVCMLFRAPQGALAPPAEVQERALAELLSVSGVAPRGVTYFNLALFDRPQRGSSDADEQYRQGAIASLRQQDAVILASAPSDPVAKHIAKAGVHVVNVARVHDCAESIAAPLSDDGGPRPIRAVFTGMAPLVERTQRELLGSLGQGMIVAVALVAGVITLGLMNAPAALLAMVPAALPLVATLGALGWLGVKIDLGLAMTAGVALGLAAQGVLHFANWYRLGMNDGLSRREAVRRASNHSLGAMVEASIVGASLAVLALSAFTPIREFGFAIVAMLAASVAANVAVLPAILASPLGWFFAPRVIRRADPLWRRIQAALARKPARPLVGAAAMPHTAPRAPHFVEEPTPARRTPLSLSSEERRELAEGPHSGLHAKLQGMRRGRTGDSPAS